MILTAGKLNVEQLYAGNIAGKPITALVVGTSSTPVTAGDAVITGALAKAITDIQYLPGNKIMFIAELDAGDPPMNIWEVGLKNSDGVLVHRKVFDSVKQKVAGLAYRITYTIPVK